ncbi:MAG: DNA polymerase-3 subunit alpha, partial [Francisellaceae bacterium]
DTALKIINAKLEKNNEPKVEIDKIPMDDKASFALLQRAETTGVFQLESSGMKQLISKLLPDCFEDIIALVALYRPGPLGSGMVDDFVNCKHGRQSVKYPHPSLESVLKQTYGTILYQEQVMQIAQILAKYSLGGADILRRAMGKKDPIEMATQREVFEKGSIANGLDKDLATSIFDLMEEFAKYGFNKSHSAAYALIAYQTSWLKAHYTSEFMAALLSSDMDNTDKIVNFLLECKAINVKVINPHVNHSSYYFTVNDSREVVYGLGAIKGMGEAVIDMIVKERKKNGDYKDIFDFCQRVDLTKVNKRVLEALTYSGSFDGMTNHRAQTLATMADAIRAAEQLNKDASTGQNDLFGFSKNMLPSNVDVDFSHQYVECKKWTFREFLQYEKQVIGMSLSGHLIDEVKYWLELFKIPKLSQLQPTHRKVSVKFSGVVISMVQRKTKKGSIISFITLDDSSERLEMMVFSDLYEQVKDTIKLDDIVMIEGEIGIDSYTDRLRISAKSIIPFNQAISLNVNSLNLHIDPNKIHFEEIKRIHQLLSVAEEILPEQERSFQTINIKCNAGEYGINFKQNIYFDDVVIARSELNGITGIDKVEFVV